MDGDALGTVREYVQNIRWESQEAEVGGSPKSETCRNYIESTSWAVVGGSGL